LICSPCDIKLKSNYIYVDRVRISVGCFCPLCCRQYEFSDKFRDYQEQLIEQQKERKKQRPKFGKQRKACPYCKQKGIVNRSKWYIRKMKVKPHESKSWKCTCKLCGGVWTQNTGDEYYHIDKNLPKPEELLGAPL